MKVKEESEKVGLKLNIQKTKIMASGPISSCQIDGRKLEILTDFIFLGSKITVNGDCSHEIKRCLLLGRSESRSFVSNCLRPHGLSPWNSPGQNIGMGSYDKSRYNMLKIKDITLLTRVRLVKSCAFSSSYVQMWELDHKDSRVLKNWCFWILVLEKTLLRIPLTAVGVKPVNPKGNQPWVFTGRPDAKAPVLQPPDARNWLIGKDPYPGRRFRVEASDKGMRWMDGITNLIVMSKVQEIVQDRESWHDAILGDAQSLTQFSDWTAMELLLESNEIALKLAFWAFFKQTYK